MFEKPVKKSRKPLKLHIFLTRTIFYHIFSVFMQKDLKK